MLKVLRARVQEGEDESSVTPLKLKEKRKVDGSPAKSTARVTPPTPSTASPKRKRDDEEKCELQRSFAELNESKDWDELALYGEEEEDGFEDESSEYNEGGLVIETESEESESEAECLATKASEAYDAFDPFLFMKQLAPKKKYEETPVLPPLVKGNILNDELAMSPPSRKKKRTVQPLQKTHTLVLDLDETLVHSSMEPLSTADFVFTVQACGTSSTVYVKIRPHLHHFLQTVKQHFELVVFTASHKAYASILLDHLDPDHTIFDHRLYRDACSNVDGLYLKDLDRLGRDLTKTAIVDNTPYVFAYQPDNAIPIDSWFEDASDTALLDLIPFLDHLRTTDDVRPLLKTTFHIRQKINQAGTFLEQQSSAFAFNSDDDDDFF